jgi:hypothetical protein
LRGHPAPRALASALLGLACVATLAQSARASELSWEGPALCSERDQLLFQIEQALGAPLAKVADLHFAVRVERVEAPLIARLSVARDSAEAPKERVLTGKDCTRLVDTLTVAVALALGAQQLEQESLHLSAPAPPLLPPPRQEPAQDVPAAAAEPGAGSGFRGGALALLVSDLGSLPAGGLGAALGVELGWTALQLRLTGTMFFDQHVAVALPNGGLGEADLNLAVGSLLACTNALSTPAARVAVPLCAGLELGRLAGVARGVPNGHEGVIPWVAPLAEAGLFWGIPGTGLRLGALISAVVPLNRDEFVLRGIGSVHQPSSLAGRGSVGVDVFFE